MYGSSLYDRPRTDNTTGHARRALDDLHVHGRLVKGGPPRSRTLDDMERLRIKWPRHALARIRRESLQQSITEKAQISMLNSQLSQVRAQMPAWGGPAQHVAHRDYILGALRKLGVQNVADSSAPSSAPAAAAFADPVADPAATEPAAASSSAAAADPDVTPAAKPRAKPKPRARTNIYVRP